MTHAPVDRVRELMNGRHFGQALSLLRVAIADDPLHWNAWYLAGCCYSSLNEPDLAVAHLSRAAQLQPDFPDVYLTLGLTYTRRAQWDDAVHAYRRAIELRPDFDAAYNGLALMQLKIGQLEKSLHNFDAGAKALARRVVKTMRDAQNPPILKHRDTVGNLWTEYAFYAALYLVAEDPRISRLVLPTAPQAIEEERTEAHGSLYWIDSSQNESETFRLLLPNYFNTFRETLKLSVAYAHLIEGCGEVLTSLGRNEEAKLHLDEAIEFLPTR